MAVRCVIVPRSQDAFIEALVKAGRYDNSNSAMRAGIQLLQDQEAALMDVRVGMLEGLVEADRGETIDGEEAIRAVFETLRSKRQG